jgi:hypothetical protein
MEKFYFSQVCLVSWRLPVPLGHLFLKIGKFSAIILLNAVRMPLACTSSLSMVVCHRFDLLMVLEFFHIPFPAYVFCIRILLFFSFNICFVFKP